MSLVPWKKMQISNVVFEGTYGNYVYLSPPSWVYNYGAEKFVHLVYNAGTQDNMLNAVALSKKWNAGYIYVTPNNVGNDMVGAPYDTLSSWGTTDYWSALVAATSCSQGKND
jgi:hypothetical protein